MIYSEKSSHSSQDPKRTGDDCKCCVYGFEFLPQSSPGIGLSASDHRYKRNIGCLRIVFRIECAAQTSSKTRVGVVASQPSHKSRSKPPYLEWNSGSQKWLTHPHQTKGPKPRMPWYSFCSARKERIVAIQSLVIEIEWTTNLKVHLGAAIRTTGKRYWYLKSRGHLGSHHEADARAYPRTNACENRGGGMCFPTSELRRYWGCFPRYFIVCVPNRNSSDSRQCPIKRMIVIVAHRINQPRSVLTEDCIFNHKKSPTSRCPSNQRVGGTGFYTGNGQ